MKWFRFYHDALDDPKVQRLPGDLYKFWVNMLCLASRSDERGLIQMSVEEIAFDVRLDDETAASLMAELIQRDLIDETCEGFQIHNWNARQFKSDNVSERVSKHRERQKMQDETLQETLHVTPDETLKPSVNTDSQINRDTEGINPPNPPRKKSKGKTLSPEQLARFERWYSEWPRKVNRAKAEEKWAEIDPDDELTEVMVAKTQEWASSPEWTKDGGQYIPHPATWLHNKRWTDGSPSKPTDDQSWEIISGGNSGPGPRGYTAAQLVAMSREENVS